MHARNHRQRNTEWKKDAAVLRQMAILASGRNARTRVRGVFVIEPLGPCAWCFKDSKKSSGITSNEIVLHRMVNNQRQRLDMVWGFPHSR